MNTKIAQIKELLEKSVKTEDKEIKKSLRNQAIEVFKTLTPEEMKEIEVKHEYKNINGHNYSGWNKYFLSILGKPGEYGTFNQWKTLNRNVKKGSKGFAIAVPILDEEDNIKYMKVVYVFHKDDTEAIEG